MLSNCKIIPKFLQTKSFIKPLVFKTLETSVCSSLMFNKNICTQIFEVDCFSKFFEEMDHTDVQSYSARKFYNKKYRGLIDLWKKPLERKKKRQQTIRQIKQALPQIVPESEKLIVHNASIGIKYPPNKDQIFCIVKVDGFQYKLTQNCILILDTKEQHQINKTIKFQQILLAGTPTYTLLGRPNLEHTYVQGMIEAISDSQKTLVFKKKRRKQYKKSFGSRVKLTTCRITRIVHKLQESTLSRATNLIGQSHIQSQN